MRSNNRARECRVIRREAIGRLLNRRRERQQGRSENGTLALNKSNAVDDQVETTIDIIRDDTSPDQLFGFSDFNFADASLQDPIGESFDIPTIPKLCS